MESEEEDPIFRLPGQPAPIVEEKRQAGGKRRGSGRKRLYEEGYESVHGLIWKTMSLHTNIFEQWTNERKRRGFKTNNDLAIFLLEIAKTRPAGQSTSGESTLTIGEEPQSETMSMRYV